MRNASTHGGQADGARVAALRRTTKIPDAMQDVIRSLEGHLLLCGRYVEACTVADPDPLEDFLGDLSG